MPEENILQYSMRVQDARNGLAQPNGAAILKAVCSVDMDANTRQQLLAALRREGALLA